MLHILGGLSPVVSSGSISSSVCVQSEGVNGRKRFAKYIRNQILRLKAEEENESQKVENDEVQVIECGDQRNDGMDSLQRNDDVYTHIHME